MAMMLQLMRDILGNHVTARVYPGPLPETMDGETKEFALLLEAPKNWPRENYEKPWSVVSRDRKLMEDVYLNGGHFKIYSSRMEPTISGTVGDLHSRAAMTITGPEDNVFIVNIEFPVGLK
jgi:hypothetical protein